MNFLCYLRFTLETILFLFCVFLNLFDTINKEREFGAGLVKFAKPKEEMEYYDTH